MGRIEELEELLKKATPGPWRIGGIDGDCVLTESRRTNTHVVCYCYKDNEVADAEVMIAAVNALPDFIALAKAARRLRDSWEGYTESRAEDAIVEALAKLDGDGK